MNLCFAIYTGPVNGAIVCNSLEDARVMNQYGCAVLTQLTKGASIRGLV
jgi:hypothetical protein